MALAGSKFWFENSTVNTDEFSRKCALHKSGYYLDIERMYNVLPMVLIIGCGVAVISNLSLVIMLVRGWQLKSKRLVFITNRSVCDLITAVMCLIYLYFVKITCNRMDCKSQSIFPESFLQIIVMLNFWSLSVTYFGMAILTAYAVRMPLRYKLNLSVMEIIKVIVIGWLTMIAILAGAKKFGNDILFDANGIIYMIGHRYHGRLENYMVEICDILDVQSLQLMGVLSFLLPIISYFMTIISYVFVICMLSRRHRVHCVFNFNHHRASVWRLGVHIFIYTMSFALMGISFWATYPLAQSCDEWSNRAQNKSSLMHCDTDYIHAFIRHGVFTSLSGIGWFTRMTIDPIIDLLTDTHLRKQIFARPRSRQPSYFSQIDRKQSYCLQNLSLNVNETLA